ncbi:hypothetical protein HMI56_004948 [Coelomomyces lativittatus]|nr:hypothetical protein HMI56_004948 [Coelomomyces lativittatus]
MEKKTKKKKKKLNLYLREPNAIHSSKKRTAVPTSSTHTPTASSPSTPVKRYRGSPDPSSDPATSDSTQLAPTLVSSDSV